MVDDEHDERDRTLDLLAAVSDSVEPGPVASLARPLLELLSELSGLEAVYLTRIDWEAAQQHIEVARNTDEDFRIDEGLVVNWQDSLCELSLDTGTGWNTQVQETWGHRQGAIDLGIQSYVSVPVQVEEGATPYGTLCGASPRTVDADPRIVKVMTLFSRLIAAALQRDVALELASARVAYAEERLAGRISFAAQVEHAMKTPIAVINGWAETLQQRELDTDTYGMAVTSIADTAKRLSDQVSDLLGEARAVVGSAAPEAVDVRRMALGLAPLAQSHDYTVHGDVVLHVDPIAFRLLLEHLVENAVAHTPPGTAIRVLVSDGGIVVEDDGPGLPPGRDDLFDPFVSADPDNPGTGLGLHIVAQIVERMGATLTAGASESGGARFELRLAG